MRFSIVIPAYNYAAYLPRAIESAMSQPGNDYEVIVVDDGSTDDTPQIGSRYELEYPASFRYVRQQNGGPAKARNRGIREARGEYLVFLDADDRLLPQALESFRCWCDRWPDLGMAFGGHQSCHSDGRVRIHAPATLSGDRLKNFTRYLRREFGISNGSAIVSKKVFDLVQYPDELRNSEDIPVFAQTLALFDCYSSPEVVLEVVKHDDSLRNNIGLVMNTGSRLVDILFDDRVLPSHFMPMRQEFAARHFLSLFRSLYLAGRYAEARGYFHAAVRRFPRLIGQWSHLSKYFRSYFKG